MAKRGIRPVNLSAADDECSFNALLSATALG